MATIDNILTKAQVAAAKKDLVTAIQRELGNEIRLTAARVARKFVKENMKEISRDLKALFAKELKSEYPRLIKEAVKRTDISMADRW